MTSQILELTLAFLSTSFPTWPKTSGQKCKYKNKELLRWEKSTFDLFKGFSVKQIKLTVLEGDIKTSLVYSAFSKSCFSSNVSENVANEIIHFNVNATLVNVIKRCWIFFINVLLDLCNTFSPEEEELHYRGPQLKQIKQVLMSK